MSLPIQSGSMSENMYYEASNPIDLDGVRISQTPGQALSHAHFKIGFVVNIIACFLINVAFAAVLLSSSDRIGFNHILKYVIDNDTKYVYAGSSIIIDLAIALPLVVLFSVWIADCGVRGDVAKGKALPIPARELRPYRFFGVTHTNVFLRIFVMILWIMATVFPFVYGMLFLSCENGTMDSYSGPETKDLPQCYINRHIYIWYKGLACALACLVYSPFVELAGLNRDNLTDIEYNNFLATQNVTTDIEAQSDLTHQI